MTFVCLLNKLDGDAARHYIATLWNSWLLLCVDGTGKARAGDTGLVHRT